MEIPASLTPHIITLFIRVSKRGGSPSFLSSPSPLKKRDTEREASPLLHNQSPFPLSRGRGIKGDGVNKIKPKGGEVDNTSFKLT